MGAGVAGYSGRVVSVLPPCGSDPGMSGSKLQIVEVEVDGDAPENQAVQQHLDVSEGSLAAQWMDGCGRAPARHSTACAGLAASADS